MKRSYYLAYTLLLILIINSAYLSYKYFNFYYGGNLLDNLNCSDGCDSVMMSPYAMFAGIPVPAFGLAYFIILTIAFLLYSKSILDQKFFDLLIFAGVLAALAFLYILYFKLHMMCKFCLLSHIGTGLFAINYFTLIRD